MSSQDDWLWLRTFPHSNSKRKQADRYKEDLKEIAEYTSALPTLRNGMQKCPSSWDDVPTHSVCKKYKTKPKKNNHKRDTIRRKEEIDDFSDWDSEEH